ncbi:M15 family metallopeptidase [Francisella philomiragia]|uniref:M15 family metallopeptidase n=1 Tax=Francisella philomiragia TaxID=28110 RepID=UPI0005A56488|nr:M15 family metallopeptidase [Francisella philomiragia]AJI55314.1 D-alanyl-D-alanine carboxypeptidase family protein [Francisella philomiragia]MBK2025987.1 D-alanyl-D-alanine carboxypeptidase family protein [Francisella philomiragia]MBK2252272.1 D-alanyl-D-alanine carboxypeptidase family protein [Francisella philomiragia]MBK2295872.1 D-alanyl-D-alanine carboxypeptidase family protein [Francisella philomiragia]MBK2340245.1 D-alanyl-D-alanine carboxypeptidase family protein [Francisella philom
MVKKIIFPEADKEDLTYVGEDFFCRDLFLEKTTYQAWLKLKQAAENEGVCLYIVSGFRSYEYQQKIIDRKLASGQTLEQIMKVNALPGESEHHTGRAIDLTTDDEKEVLTELFEDTLAFKWLSKNAHRFGFKMSFPRDNEYGYIYEPWHWCYQNEEK